MEEEKTGVEQGGGEISSEQSRRFLVLNETERQRSEERQTRYAYDEEEPQISHGNDTESLYSEHDDSSDYESDKSDGSESNESEVPESEESSLENFKEMIFLDFKRYMEQRISCEIILSACIQKANEDLKRIKNHESTRTFERNDSSTSLSSFFRNYKKWHEFRENFVAILEKNSCALNRVMAYSAKVRIITASLCFLTNLRACLTFESAFQWKKILIFAASGFSFLGLLSTFLEKMLSRHFLEESADAFSYDEKFSYELKRSIYMDNSAYSMFLSTITTHIDWEVVMHIRKYFDHEIKQLMFCHSLLTDFRSSYLVNCNALLYFSLLLASSSKNTFILDGNRILTKMLLYSVSQEGFIFWHCMTLRQHPNPWDGLILRLDTFPKRRMLLFQLFPAISFSLYRFHPFIGICNLFFSSVTIFSTVADLYKGITSKQLSTMRKLRDSMVKEHKSIQDIFYVLHL